MHHRAYLHARSVVFVGWLLIEPAWTRCMSEIAGVQNGRHHRR